MPDAPQAQRRFRAAQFTRGRVEVDRGERDARTERELVRGTGRRLRRETEFQFALERHGRWGGRWDSNPQQQGSQPWTLPLSYGHHCTLACPAGLEPTTPSLEGWCSIRLSYGQSASKLQNRKFLVGARGFEPPTSCSQSKRATRLRHAPKIGGK